MVSFKQYSDPWGWSKLDTYRECPQKFKFQYIDKLPTEASPAFRRGTEVHKAVEAFLNGWVKNLPVDMPKDWVKRLTALRARKVRTEAAWGVDASWNPLPNWMHPLTWLRAKSDIFYIDHDTLMLIDIKTGKYRIPSKDQVELYAIVGHCFHPEVKQIRTSFWFVDQESAPHEEVYAAKELVNLREKYKQELIRGIYKDRRFQEKPSDKCRYCSFTRQKRGPCKY